LMSGSTSWSSWSQIFPVASRTLLAILVYCLVSWSYCLVLLVLFLISYWHSRCSWS
jgi:hypothetical protein